MSKSSRSRSAQKRQRRNAAKRHAPRSYRPTGATPSGEAASIGRPAEVGTGAIWFSVVFIGICAWFFGWLLDGVPGGTVGVAAWSILVLYHLAVSTAGVYRGTVRRGWRVGLAAFPLRLAGFGREGGKPVHAAHGAPAGRTASIATAAASAALIVALFLAAGRVML